MGKTLYNRKSCTKDEYDTLFKTFGNKGVGISELVSGRHRLGHYILKKKSFEDTSQNPNHLDNFPKIIMFLDYEKSMC